MDDHQNLKEQQTTKPDNTSNKKIMLSKKRKRTPPDIRVEVNFASLARLADSECII